MKKNIIFIVGPTGIGKSGIAVHLARKARGEIISCDSMQVYKGMDIMTSKTPLALRDGIPHHLLGIISPVKEYSVQSYYKDTARLVKEILKRGRVPIVTGGTGLYMSVLIEGIFKINSESKLKAKKIKEKLIQRAEKEGSKVMHQYLARIDPEAAAKIHPNDTRRIVRAIEVFEATGKPISRLQKERKGLGGVYAIRVFGLNMPRERLYKRIDERVEEMFNLGLLSEIKKLLKLKLSRTAGYALGIREVKGFLDGLYDLEEAKRLLKKNTRNYAKRQMTWFRKDRRINWIDIGDKVKPETIANRILKKLSP
ncbi:MAG: tRNA (adenosine(37)-N6)-dimethylallyltransferase MiaA [Candidatus Omnitrophota bacterium]